MRYVTDLHEANVVEFRLQDCPGEFKYKKKSFIKIKKKDRHKVAILIFTKNGIKSISLSQKLKKQTGNVKDLFFNFCKIINNLFFY